ncbi:MAG: tRNA (adenosine(37)-N6)-threonylcarbamoyltransferase complex dimerization subunit type 1 TsaB [Lentisphaeria bacterium]|nr:tRNA (adenosine(37)-N6)-threonylcarbamoyltransferase complex dimerization subunit type 1 TsaB [Lentisphaeria bacterium]
MYEAALDTATGQAAFAVQDQERNLILNLKNIPSGRASSELFPTIQKELKSRAIEISLIKHWSIGMGPGSFTGIRVGAALAKGIVTGNEGKLRGVPTSLALVLQVALPTENKVAALFDGRKGEILIHCYVRNKSGEFEAEEAYAEKIEQLHAVDVERFVIVSTDPVLKSLPMEVLKKTAVVSSVDAAMLLNPPTYCWKNEDTEFENASKPIYIRPAVFVDPIQTRKLNIE